MDLIFSIPYILRILITLSLILIVNKITKNLIIAILSGILTLAFWSGHSEADILYISWQRLTTVNNIFLIAIIFQVIWLSTQMKESGVMEDLVKSIRARISQKAAMAVLPAIIGLLPMPGGALFSAPLVEDCDHNKTIENHLKTKINYWFRHIWEYWWLLYPGVLLAIDITGLNVWQFVLLQLPLSIFSILGGILFLLRKIPSNTGSPFVTIQKKHKNILLLILPILVVVFIYVLIRIFIPFLFQISKYLPIFIGLIAAQIILQVERPLAGKKWKKIIFSQRAFKLAAIIAFIQIYGAFIAAELPLNSIFINVIRKLEPTLIFLEIKGPLLMDYVSMELFRWGIPIIAVIMIIPFISGLTTGIAIGFVGASFPIVIKMLGINPPLNELLAYTVLAYGFGYIGMILSPVHVCLLVTNEYFKTNLLKNIIQLIKPASIVLLGSLLLHFLILYLA